MRVRKPQSLGRKVTAVTASIAMLASSLPAPLLRVALLSPSLALAASGTQEPSEDTLVAKTHNGLESWIEETDDAFRVRTEALIDGIEFASWVYNGHIVSRDATLKKASLTGDTGTVYAYFMYPTRREATYTYAKDPSAAGAIGLYKWTSGSSVQTFEEKTSPFRRKNTDYDADVVAKPNGKNAIARWVATSEAHPYWALGRGAWDETPQGTYYHASGFNLFGKNDTAFTNFEAKFFGSVEDLKQWTYQNEDEGTDEGAPRSLVVAAAGATLNYWYDANQGSVTVTATTDTGTGTYDFVSETTGDNLKAQGATAVPKDGYTFLGWVWRDRGCIVSDNATLSAETINALYPEGKVSSAEGTDFLALFAKTSDLPSEANTQQVSFAHGGYAIGKNSDGYQGRTWTSNGGGSVALTNADGGVVSFNTGSDIPESVKATATPAEGYHFLYWVVAPAGYDIATKGVYDQSVKYVRERTLSAEDLRRINAVTSYSYEQDETSSEYYLHDKSCTTPARYARTSCIAVFEKDEASDLVFSAGVDNTGQAGGTVKLANGDAQGAQESLTQSDKTPPNVESVTAVPNEGYHFIAWAALPTWGDESIDGLRSEKQIAELVSEDPTLTASAILQANNASVDRGSYTQSDYTRFVAIFAPGQAPDPLPTKLTYYYSGPKVSITLNANTAIRADGDSDDHYLSEAVTPATQVAGATASISSDDADDFYFVGWVRREYDPESKKTTETIVTTNETLTKDDIYKDNNAGDSTDYPGAFTFTSYEAVYHLKPHVTLGAEFLRVFGLDAPSVAFEGQSGLTIAPSDPRDVANVFRDAVATVPTGYQFKGWWRDDGGYDSDKNEWVYKWTRVGDSETLSAGKLKELYNQLLFPEPGTTSLYLAARFAPHTFNAVFHSSGGADAKSFTQHITYEASSDATTDHLANHLLGRNDLQDANYVADESVRAAFAGEDGKTFVGWATQAKDAYTSADAIYQDESVMQAAISQGLSADDTTVDLYPVWLAGDSLTSLLYDIYDADGHAVNGSITPRNELVDRNGGSAPKGATVTPDVGYHFSAWGTRSMREDAEGVHYSFTPFDFESQTETITPDQVKAVLSEQKDGDGAYPSAYEIAARLDPNAYTVTFSAGNGAMGSVDTLNGVFGTASTLPSGEGLAKEGFTFVGWYSAELGKTLPAGASTTDYDRTFAATDGKKNELVAEWRDSAASVEVKYESLNPTMGTVSVTSELVAADKTAAASQNLLGSTAKPNDHYVFAGWYVKGQDDDYVPVEGNLGSTLAPANVRGALKEEGGSYVATTFYAKFAPETYTVYFYEGTTDNSDYGKLVSDLTLTYGRNAAVPSASELGISRSGYTFVGWKAMVAPDHQPIIAAGMSQASLLEEIRYSDGRDLIAQWAPARNVAGPIVQPTNPTPSDGDQTGTKPDPTPSGEGQTETKTNDDGSTTTTTTTEVENTDGSSTSTKTEETVAQDGTSTKVTEETTTNEATGETTVTKVEEARDANGELVSSTTTTTSTSEVAGDDGATVRTETSEKVTTDVATGAKTTETVEQVTTVDASGAETTVETATTVVETTDEATGKAKVETSETVTTTDAEGNETSVVTRTEALGDMTSAGDATKVTVTDADGQTTSVETKLLEDAAEIEPAADDTAEATSKLVEVTTTDAEGNATTEERVIVELTDPETGEPAEGRQVVGGDTYIAGDDGVALTGQQDYQGETYVLHPDGKMKYGWDMDADGGWRYLCDGSGDGETPGAMKKDCWLHDGTGWFYAEESGSIFADDSNNGWKMLDGQWYLFETSHDGNYGMMKTGWQFVAGEWYFLAASGEVTTGWQFDGSGWYYLNESGAMLRDTVTPDGNRVGPDGAWIA